MIAELLYGADAKDDYQTMLISGQTKVSEL